MTTITPPKAMIDLHFPLAVSDSSYYTNLVAYPPKGYQYLDKKSGLIGNTLKRGVFRLIKSGVRKASTSFALSRPLYSRKNKFSPGLVHHFAHCLPTMKESNSIDFIVDIEGAWQLAIGVLSPSVKKMVLKNLSRDNCKAIMPWTKFSYDGFIKEFPELKDKTHIVRPAVPLMQLKPRVSDPDNFMMLYVARDFELKNGPETCEIMDTFVGEMKKMSPVTIRAVVIANVSKKIKAKYPNIVFRDLMPKEELHKWYRMADVFFYPCPVDTFGFSLIEAMSFGTPVIAMKAFGTKSITEIVVNGVNGFHFDKEEFVQRAIPTLYDWIEDREVWQMYSNNCIALAQDGPYSLNQRNQTLNNILEKCTIK